MNITQIRKRIAERGVDGLAAEHRADLDRKYGEGSQPPLTDAEQATVNYYAERARERRARIEGALAAMDTPIGDDDDPFEGLDDA